MPIHIVKVIRELTDSVTYFKEQNAKSFCADVEQNTHANWSPNTDIVEYPDYVIIKMELAGVEKKDISVKVKNGMLQICGVRYENTAKSRISIHQLELHYGRFVKNIHLPEFMEHNPITANLRDGILEITISKNSEIVEIPIVEGTGQESKNQE